MFVRIKSTPNSPKKSIQIVASVRKGNSVSQKIVRHIGVAFDDDELEKMKMLAESIKVKLEADQQQLLFTPEQLARIKKGPQIEPTKDNAYHVNLKDLVEEQRVVRGIHEIYGTLFDQLGYHQIFPNPARIKAMVDAFKQMVLARVANPLSKRASVDMLEEDFGVSLDLTRVYRMMDKIDEKAIEKLNDLTYKNTVTLFHDKIDVIFFDATTIYFESFTADELKDLGYSKDLKFNQPQVLLGMLVNQEGLPLGYRVYSGNTYEGHTLIPMLKEIRARYQIDKVVWVADGGMLNEKNIKAMEEEGIDFIVGARLKNLNKEVQEKILDPRHYRGTADYRIAKFSLSHNRQLIVSYKKSRAEKDARDRNKALEKLQEKLKKGKNPKEFLSNYGYKKYLKVIGESQFQLDVDKIEKQRQWDGLHGVITNVTTLTDKEILKQYVNLWHVEEAFRVTKHDLKVRPVFHWTPRRVRAHLAICFSAYALVRHLEYRVRLQYKSLSPERIRQILTRVQTSILYHVKKRIRFSFPSRLTQEAKKIYQLMNVPLSSTPQLLGRK